MAVLRCDFGSSTLGVQTSMSVVLPDDPPPPEGYPTLYLLHGLSDDHTMWLRRTAVETEAVQRRLVVVMPDVGRSFYTDEVFGQRYWTFLSEELPTRVEAMFRLSTDSADRFVAGLSMGGYGAFKWALRCPERFAAAASLSGALDIGRIQSVRRDPVDLQQMTRLFGNRPAAGTPDDLFGLIAEVEDPPALYLCCGTEDDLLDDNRRFLAACDSAGVPVTRDLGPGAHDWPYWNRSIRNVLDWLQLRVGHADPVPADAAVTDAAVTPEARATGDGTAGRR